MSQLALSKLYGDSTLLFKADFDTMWSELETKTNGNIDSDNVASGWASWNQVTLSKDSDYTFGTTNSGIVRFYTSTNEFVFAHDTTAKDTIFKIAGTEVARIDSSANFSVKKDIYFYNRSTVFPLSRLLGVYQKPVLVYSDGTTINVEQNTETANRTLIVFPAGPIAVTEDISLTHKFRQLKTSASANGYASGQTGAADSGMRVGVTLTANTWYFVYAVVVQFGDDAAGGADNFILVADSTSPKTSNWSTLDTRYGAGMWLYLGAFRYGHGGASTTTMIPFLYDHQGWCHFTGRAAANDFFGIRVVESTTVSSTSYTSMFTATAADSGNAVPDTMSALKLAYRLDVDADGHMHGLCAFGISTTSILWDMPSFGDNLNVGEYHGWHTKIPNNQGIQLLARKGVVDANDDFLMVVYITAFLDEWV